MTEPKEPIEDVIARLREKRPHWSEAVQDDIYWASQIEADLSRLLDYVEGMSKGTDEKAWLIESFHAGYALWWSRTDNADDGVCGWSDDSLKAIRFSRSVDAQAIIDEHGWTEAHPSEHMWCDPTHKWAFFERFGFTSCEVCGIVRRADGANGPCKGPVSVGPRGALPPAPLHGK